METMNWKIIQNWEEINSYRQPGPILPYGKKPFWPKEKTDLEEKIDRALMLLLAAGGICILILTLALIA